MREGWRLAVGTLTALRVAPPSHVDRAVARTAMLLAPLAVLPLAVAVALVVLVGPALGLPSLAVGLLGVAVLVLGTRALHVDGLSDTADGLTASYDRERSLTVMRSGTSGPAGGAAVLVVLGLQASGLGAIAASADAVPAAVLAGAVVCASRLALWAACADGVPGARSEGLGVAFVSVVPRLVAVAGAVLAAVVLAVLAAWAGAPWWEGALVVPVAAAGVLAVLRRAVTRLGGTTGDVLGAVVEVALAVLAVGAAAVVAP